MQSPILTLPFHLLLLCTFVPSSALCCAVVSSRCPPRTRLVMQAKKNQYATPVADPYKCVGGLCVSLQKAPASAATRD